MHSDLTSMEDWKSMVKVLLERELDMLADRLLIRRVVAVWSKKQISSINNVAVFHNSMPLLDCPGTHQQTE